MQGASVSFRARLDATQAILAATKGRPNYDMIRENERNELLQALDLVSVRGKEAADIIQAVKSAGLPEADEEVLISRVAERLTAAPTAPAQGLVQGFPRGGGPNNTNIMYQDFTSIVHYIPEKVWAYSKECKNGIAILKTAIALGLRRGTEPTYKILSLLVHCSTQGIEYVQSMPPAQRTAAAKSIKPQVQELASYAGPPTVLLQQLPASPEELQVSHPDLYATVYNNGNTPSPVPYDPVTWGMLVSGTRCRIEKGSKGQVGVTPFGPSSPQSACSGVDANMAYLMQQMTQMNMMLQSSGRALEDGPRSGGINLTFPNRCGTPQKGETGTLNLALPGPSGALACSAAPAASAPAPSAPAAAPATSLPPPTTASSAPPPTAPAAAPTAGDAGRMDVAAATANILAHISKPLSMKALKTKLKKRHAPTGKKKKSTATEEPAPAPKAKAKPKAKPKNPPKISYRAETDHFQCYYNKLPCKSFMFSKKKEKKKAQTAAEDICGKHIGRASIFLAEGSRDGVRPSKLGSGRCPFCVHVLWFPMKEWCAARAEKHGVAMKETWLAEE